MLEFVAGVLLSAAAVYYVLRPIFHPHAAPAGAGLDVSDGDGLEEDVSPRAQALRALREIEFDRATGKLSDADHDALRAKYTALALEALRGEGGRSGAPLPFSPIPLPVCPADGARPEPDAVFCSACGRRLGAAPGYCARCGTTLEPDARFCARCGMAVAA